MPLVTATQSATPNALLDAVATVLANGNGVQPGIGVDAQYIVESYSGYRPRSAEPYEVVYGLIGEQPEMYSGGGRLAHDTYWILQITLYTRLELDVSGSDYSWSRNTSYGALVLRTKIADVVQDQFLFSSYSDTTHLPTGNLLLIEGMQQLPSPRPVKPDRDTTAVSDGGDVGGYGEHHMFFQLKTVQPLTRAL